MVNLGLIIGETETRINCFYGHVESFQVDGARHKRKHHVLAIHYQVVNTVVLYPLVKVLEVFGGGVLAHDGKLGAVHAVPLSHIKSFHLDHLGEFLQHPVPEGVAVNFIQVRKLRKSQHHNLDFLALPGGRTQIVHKAVKAPGIGHVVEIAQGIVVSDRTSKEFGSPVLVPNEHSSAGTHDIASVLGLDTILLMVITRIPVIDIFYAFLECRQVVRMYIPHPDRERVLHVFRR